MSFVLRAPRPTSGWTSGNDPPPDARPRSASPPRKSQTQIPAVAALRSSAALQGTDVDACRATSGVTRERARARECVRTTARPGASCAKSALVRRGAAPPRPALEGAAFRCAWGVVPKARWLRHVRISIGGWGVANLAEQANLSDRPRVKASGPRWWPSLVAQAESAHDVLEKLRRRVFPAAPARTREGGSQTHTMPWPRRPAPPNARHRRDNMRAQPGGKGVAAPPARLLTGLLSWAWRRDEGAMATTWVCFFLGGAPNLAEEPKFGCVCGVAVYRMSMVRIVHGCLVVRSPGFLVQLGFERCFVFMAPILAAE